MRVFRVTMIGGLFATMGAVSAAAAIDVAPVTVTPPIALVSAGPALAPMALNSLSDPPPQIATARVVDATGTVVGSVQKVDIAGGKPSDVQIALLGSEQVVALDAGKVSYDLSNNVLVADLDKNQIVQLPTAAPQG
jgi:hypothetical protein